MVCAHDRATYAGSDTRPRRTCQSSTNRSCFHNVRRSRASDARLSPGRASFPCRSCPGCGRGRWHHVAVVGDLGVIGNAPVTWNDQRAAGTMRFRHTQVDQSCSGWSRTPGCCLRLEVDEWIPCQIDEVARADHIGLAEEDDGVAIGIPRKVHHDHRLVVEVEPFLIIE